MAGIEKSVEKDYQNHLLKEIAFQKAEIYVDTSGETLAKHSYRKIPGRAPMLEALAAGTILATGWDQESNFVNPMCGSGTLAIEAALIATKRAPGLFRMNYSFMHILGYKEEVFLEERRQLKEQVVKQIDFKKTLTLFKSDSEKDDFKKRLIDFRIAYNKCVDKMNEFGNANDNEKIVKLTELKELKYELDAIWLYILNNYKI